MTYQEESFWARTGQEMKEYGYAGLAETLAEASEQLLIWGIGELYKNLKTQNATGKNSETNKSEVLSPWHELLLPLSKEENDKLFKQLVVSGCGIQISEYKQRVSNEGVHRLKFAYLNSSQFINIENLYVDDVGLTIKLNSDEEYLYEWDIFSSFKIIEENNYLTINTNLFRLATTIDAQLICWLLYSFYIVYSTRASILCGGIVPDILTSVPKWAITEFMTLGMEENICKLLGSNGLPSKHFLDNCYKFRNTFLYPINSLKK